MGKLYYLVKSKNDNSIIGISTKTKYRNENIVTDVVASGEDIENYYNGMGDIYLYDIVNGKKVANEERQHDHNALVQQSEFLDNKKQEQELAQLEEFESSGIPLTKKQKEKKEKNNPDNKKK
jgi:heterodisulfide reductase subunit A-like polyferredoxin